MPDESRKWPPITGDFEVRNPNDSVAVCTLGKKIDVPADFAIIGTCKTENIGIERVIVNVISNVNIRFFILAGPEIPGHLTGQSLLCLYNNGIDEKTRRIIDAPGAIPYIENISLESVERFRKQVQLIDMLRVQDATAIADAVSGLSSKNPGPFPEDPIWVDMKVKSSKQRRIVLSASINVIPEIGLSLDHLTSLLSGGAPRAMLATHPNDIGAELKETEDGTVIVGKEL